MLVSKHDKILNSPIIAPMLAEQNKEIYDGGMTEFFKYGAIRPSALNFVFPGVDNVQETHERFYERAADSVKNKEFDIIIVSQGYSSIVPEREIEKYYDRKETIRVILLHSLGGIKLNVWKPKSDAPSDKQQPEAALPSR